MISSTVRRIAPWLLLLVIAVAHALLTQQNFDYRVAVILGRVLLCAMGAAGLLVVYAVLYRIIRKQPLRELIYVWGVLALAAIVALELLQWLLE